MQAQLSSFIKRSADFKGHRFVDTVARTHNIGIAASGAGR